MKTTHLAGAALALAIAMSPPMRVQASSLGQAGHPGRRVGGLTREVKLMKKAKKPKGAMMMRKAKRKPGRQARSRGTGHAAGENMYWGRKAGKSAWTRATRPDANTQRLTIRRAS